MAVYAETLADMISLFRALVGEEAGNTAWTDTVIKLLINEAQLEVVEETRCLEEDWTSSVSAWASAGDEIVNLANSFFDDAFIQIWWVDSDSVMHELKELHARYDSIQNDSATDTPSEFFRVGRNIHLKPLPDADGTVRIHGKRLPDNLTSDTDQSLIPPAYRGIPVYLAAVTALFEDDEERKGSNLYALYQRKLSRLHKYAKKMRSKRKAAWHIPSRIKALT